MKKKLMLLMLMAISAMSIDARNLNIRGKLTMANGDEANGVIIWDAATNKRLGISDEFGSYNITADSETQLIFSGQSIEEHTEPVNGRLVIDVTLTAAATQLEEVTVTAIGGNTMVAEETDLIIEGNYVTFNTGVTVLKKMFDSSKRVIVQPVLFNVTRDSVTYLDPEVIDGKRYAWTQRRIYDRENRTDSLFAYETIRKITGKNNDGRIPISRTTYVSNPTKDEFILEVITSIEDYNKLTYGDTFEICHGTVNPLRFLEINLTPKTVTEEEFIPTEEVELRDASGEVNLQFPVGKSTLDLSLGNNAAELDAMLQTIRTIGTSEGTTLKGFHIKGFASPEGREESNRNLAGARMKSALATITQSIDPSLIAHAEVSSEADIAPWSEVVNMLRADSLYEEADRLQDVLDRYNTLDAQSIAVGRLPFYKTKIKEDYLPRLRKVNYNIVSSYYRPLTDEEIAELYAKDPTSLSRYQFYRYYTAKEGEERENAIKQALKAYPNFVTAATDLSAIMLERKENPMNILEPFFSGEYKKRNKPNSAYYNMAVACLDSAQYSRADSILAYLPDEEAIKAKAYCTALTGKTDDVMNVIDIISEDSPLNEVLVLLKIKDNDSALRSLGKLGDSAVEEYVKATVYIRKYNADPTQFGYGDKAEAHLKKALKLDPSLIETAKIDKDVNGFLASINIDSDTPGNNDVTEENTNEETEVQ